MNAPKPPIAVEDALLGLNVGDTVYFFDEDSGTIDQLLVHFIDDRGVAYHAFQPVFQGKPATIPITSGYSKTPADAARANAEEIRSSMSLYQRKYECLKKCEALIDAKTD